MTPFRAVFTDSSGHPVAAPTREHYFVTVTAQVDKSTKKVLVQTKNLQKIFDGPISLSLPPEEFQILLKC
jgi:hypothetical protein